MTDNHETSNLISEQSEMIGIPMQHCRQPSGFTADGLQLPGAAPSARPKRFPVKCPSMCGRRQNLRVSGGEAGFRDRA